MENPDEQSSQMDVFLRRIGEALAPYQLIEEYLKFYIEAAHSKIQLSLVGRIPFRYPRSEYENAPLDRLITMFRRHSDNEDLIQRLRDARDNRNWIAHKVVGDYMEHRNKYPKVAHLISEDLTKIQNVGYNLVEELRKELSKLTAT